MLQLHQTEQGTVIRIRAQTRARRTAILGQREGALRIAVTAAPEKGKANQQIITLLGKTFSLTKSSVELIAGRTSRHKQFLLHGLSIESAERKIGTILGPEG
jgi:uncharacterized protein